MSDGYVFMREAQVPKNHHLHYFSDPFSQTCYALPSAAGILRIVFDEGMPVNGAALLSTQHSGISPAEAISLLFHFFASELLDSQLVQCASYLSPAAMRRVVLPDQTIPDLHADQTHMSHVVDFSQHGMGQDANVHSSGVAPCFEDVAAGDISSAAVPNQGLLLLASSVRSSFHKQIQQVHNLSHDEGVAQVRPDDDTNSVASFQSIAASGDSDKHIAPANKRKPAMLIATFNGNCWSTAKAFVSFTQANVICIQEHKLTGDKLAEARLWAKSNGWTSFWAPATVASGGKPSSGVAILVKAHIQAWAPSQVDPVFFKHRGIGVVVNCGNLGPCLVISAYFITNSTARTSVAPGNLRMLAELGVFIQSVGLYPCIGADWQMEPQVLQQTMFLEQFSLVLRFDESGAGSCISKGGDPVVT